jgi:ring-1,2-phenylacetyl-CoA epoxidase subunit PaaE
LPTLGDVIKVIVPNYKAKSYSMSAERPGEFDITFKVYPNGRASGYLNRLALGEAISVFRMGSKLRQQASYVGLVAFGVGITEALPIAARELETPGVAGVTLVWAARTFADTFWHDELAALGATHQNRFNIMLVLSREVREGCKHGRVTPELLREAFDGSWAKMAADATAACGADGQAGGAATDRKSCFVTVGTREMMDGADAMLGEIGHPMPANALLVLA